MPYQQISRADAAALTDRLTAAANNGSLTTEQLSAAIGVHTDNGYIPGSVGYEWISRHPDAFATNINDPAGFLEAHLDTPYVGEVLVCDENVLTVIAGHQRANLIHEAIVRCGARNHMWVGIALRLGVSRESLAQTVLEKLRRTVVDPDRSYNFLQYDFVQHGAGRIERGNTLLDAVRGLCGDNQAAQLAANMSQTPGLEEYGDDIAARLSLEEDDPDQWRMASADTLWSVLTNEQLIEAIRIVIDKAPNLLFGGPAVNEQVNLRQKLRMRLTLEEVNTLVAEAAIKLTSLQGVSFRELTRLSPSILLDVARRTNGGSIDLVVYLAFLLGSQHGGPELLDEFAGLFSNGQPTRSITVFRSLRPVLRSAGDNDMAKLIERRLLKWIEAEGFVYGQITTGHHRGRTQFQVRHNGITYVQNRRQSPNQVGDGDWVFFSPTSGRELGPRVVAVTFLLA